KRTPARIAEIPDLFFRLGRNFLLAGTPSKAVQYLSQSLSPKEKRPENWYMMGEAMYQMNMYEKSIIFFKEALKRKRNYSDAHYKVGMASLLQANPNRQQAIDHLRETIAFDKERQHVDAFKHLGFLYRDAGRSGEAAEMLRSYLRQLAPGAPDRREVLREIEALTSRRAPPPPPPLLNQPGKKKKKASDEEEG
ncbi:MAG: hypothetical protein FJ125_17305, partial [Deltaproteobacteria bacterium]|nr:hypothetical protein [Deltaproteobacteria bacterium]